MSSIGVSKLSLRNTMLVLVAVWSVICGQTASAEHILLQSGAAPSNAAQAVPAFDVASIRPSNPSDNNWAISPTPDGFNAKGATLFMLIRAAYGFLKFTDDKILGGPTWANSDRYDLQAKLDGSAANAGIKLTQAQRGLMIQKLLADRFNLKIHVETKELPVYDLVLSKTGTKLREGKVDETDPNGSIRLSNGGIIGHAIPITTLVNMLNQQRDLEGRIVIDKTGLKGKYDVTLKWVPNYMGRELQGQGDHQPAVPSSGISGPSIFTAIQEQLGLKLESARGPTEILVIDHVERPSAN